jgi:hypothetical protein
MSHCAVFSATFTRAPPIAAELLPALVVGGKAPCDPRRSERSMRSVGTHRRETAHPAELRAR